MHKLISLFFILSILILVNSMEITAKPNDAKKETFKSRSTSNDDDENDKKIDYYLVKSNNLIVKDSPSSNAYVLGTLTKGDTIRSIGFTTTTDKFELVSKLIKFNYKGQVGYVNSNFLLKIMENSAATNKNDAFSIYAGLVFLSSVMFLGLLAH